MADLRCLASRQNGRIPDWNRVAKMRRYLLVLVETRECLGSAVWEAWSCYRRMTIKKIDSLKGAERYSTTTGIPWGERLVSMNKNEEKYAQCACGEEMSVL